MCESIICTLLNIPGKMKDGLSTYLDIVVMGIREELAPQERRNKRVYLLPTCYALTRQEKQEFAVHCLRLRLHWATHPMLEV